MPPNFEEQIAQFEKELGKFDEPYTHQECDEFENRLCQLKKQMFQQLVSPVVIATFYKAMFMLLLMKGDELYQHPKQNQIAMMRLRVRRFARVGLSSCREMEEWMIDVRRYDVNTLSWILMESLVAEARPQRSVARGKD